MRIIAATAILLLLIPALIYAQRPAPNYKKDAAVFRRQMLSLEEYKKEKGRVPLLRKQHAGKEIKIVAIVAPPQAAADDEDAENSAHMLTGYIRQIIDNDSSSVYEVRFDCDAQKIVSVTSTGEGLEPDDVPDRPRKERHADRDDDEKSSKMDKEDE